MERFLAFVAACVVVLPSVVFAQPGVPVYLGVPAPPTPTYWATVRDNEPTVVSPAAVVPTVPVGTVGPGSLGEVDFDLGDPELDGLWKKIGVAEKEYHDFEADRAKRHQELTEKVMEARMDFLSDLGDKRVKELDSRRVTENIDVTKTGLTVLDFPEINGSTSCSNLARIVTCRILGVPYRWLKDTAYSPSEFSVKLRVEVDESKAGNRATGIMKGILRNFGGTHQAYCSLVEGRSQLPTLSTPVPVTTYTPPIAQMNRPLLPPTAVVPPIPSVSPSTPTTAPQETTPVDLILVARKPSADELALAKHYNVEFDVRPVAMDALVFLVNRKNPVENLTIEQISNIYDPVGRPLPPGVLTPPPALSWSDFGGRGYVGHYERERNSGSRELMDDFLAKHRKPVPPGMVAQRTQPHYTGMLTVVPSMMGPMFALNGNENGIAYSVFQYEHFMHLNPDVKVLKIEGIEPTTETIARRTYPAIAEVFVVTKKGIAENSPAAKLRDFLLGDDGQRLITESGYAPIAPPRVGDAAQRNPRTEPSNDTEELVVNITKDNKVVIGDKDATTKEEIVSLIEDRRKRDARLTDRMLIVADDQAKQETAVLLLEAASEAGMKRVRFLAKETNSSEKLPEPSKEMLEQVARLKAKGIPLTDYHIHIRGGMTPEKAADWANKTGVRSGVLENVGKGWPLSDNEKLAAFIDDARKFPELLVGVQVNDRDWYKVIDPELSAKLDFVLADTMILDGQKLWLEKDYEIPDENVWLDRYFSHCMTVVNEPISILANPTYLPEKIVHRYEDFWTTERMEKLIDAAVKKNVALEIQSGTKFPNKKFVELALKKGAKLSIGRNNHDAAPNELKRSLDWLEEFDVKPGDMLDLKRTR